MTPPDQHDGAVILDAVCAAITRYVILPSDDAAAAVALWIAATHAQPAWAHAPRLVIKAPEKRCGKSRLLDLVEALCCQPLITVNASPPAIYRSIGSDDPPTLLIDEADTIFGSDNAKTNEDLRGLLNAGHQRHRPALRYDAARQQVEQIPTFAMAALAGIGAMPDTIEDRAVIIRMRRRAPGETVAPYRIRRDGPALRTLADQLNRWLRAHLPDLEAAEPTMPVEDRAADTWEPLVAVADLAGGAWPDRARRTVLALSAATSDAGQMSTRTRLLADIRTAFALLGTPPAVPTGELLKVLNDDPEAPWQSAGPAGLTGKRLGDLLRDFEITSETIRFQVGQAKGYQRAAFEDAWARYCPTTATPPVPSVPSSFPQVIPGTDYPPGTDQSVPPTSPGTHQSVPATQSVPALSRKNELGTDGTHPRRQLGTAHP